MRTDRIRKRIKALNAKIVLLSDIYHGTAHRRTKLAAGQKIRAALRSLKRYELELIRSEEWARLDDTRPTRIGAPRASAGQSLVRPP